jgi:hypothetical protein
MRQLAGSAVDVYEYYGVERAGMLAGVEWMADLDWYGAGAAALLDAQETDGAWTGVESGIAPGDAGARARARQVVDTCFALLFLKKGTMSVRRGAVTQVGGDADVNFVVAANLTGRDLEDFLDLVLSRWRRSTDDGVRTRLFDGATSVGPRIVEPLLVRMDATDPETRAAAFELLQRAAGQDFGYLPNAPPEEREGAVVEWQTWWMTSKDRLVYDPAAKRLVVR